ncbi:unnamed protein product [Lactuca saligna]|uniref:Uncharacterized protein n=1 Tax=Lactuca saligna TaxID=75948 RepID=A0AA36EG27_LACSI|nr:unnamed protein product [Lactuca saligna]
MDSSQSQYSHSASGSVSRSGTASHPRSENGSDSRSLSRSSSGSGSGSDSESRSLSSSDAGSNSARTSSPSAVNNPLEQHPQSESSGSLKTITSADFEPEKEENVDPMNQSTPSEEHHETASSTAQENAEDNATSSHGKQRGAEEIGLLTDLYAFYNRTQHYSFIRKGDMQEFYNRQIFVYRAYATEEEVDKKVSELYENYIKLLDKKAEAPTDPIDIEIFRQSSWIWGDAAANSREDDEDSLDKKTSNDHGTEDDLKDSSKQETGDDDMKDPIDSSKQETRDGDLKDPKGWRKQENGDDDIKDSKGLSKQGTAGDVEMKDSEDFPKETGDDHKGGISTRHDWKDSSGNDGGPSAS